MGKGKTERKWYEIDAQSGAVAEVWIYEEIGTDFWGDGLTAKKFVEDLAVLDVEHIALHINSPGGSVFDGYQFFYRQNEANASINKVTNGAATQLVTDTT